MMFTQPDLSPLSKPFMTESNDFIAFTGIPEVTIPLPEKSDKQIKLDRLRFAVQELVSEFSEPYEKDQYLTATEIIDTIKTLSEGEIKIVINNDVQKGGKAASSGCGCGCKQNGPVEPVTAVASLIPSKRSLNLST